MPGTPRHRRYDSRGNQAKTYDTYYSTGNPAATLFAASEPNVETQHVYDYDGINRVTVDRLLVGNGSVSEKWHTTYAYTGDQVTVIPPDGGTPTITISDARGRTTELRQYKAATATGDYLSTKYTYTPDGKLATVTDTTATATKPGNVWRYTYDLRGRKTKQVDPDRGTTTYTYNDLDQLLSSTDAENRAQRRDPTRLRLRRPQPRHRRPAAGRQRLHAGEVAHQLQLHRRPSHHDTTGRWYPHDHHQQRPRPHRRAAAIQGRHSDRGLPVGFVRENGHQLLASFGTTQSSRW